MDEESQLDIANAKRRKIAIKNALVTLGRVDKPATPLWDDSDDEIEDGIDEPVRLTSRPDHPEPQHTNYESSVNWPPSNLTSNTKEANEALRETQALTFLAGRNINHYEYECLKYDWRSSYQLRCRLCNEIATGSHLEGQPHRDLR